NELAEKTDENAVAREKLLLAERERIDLEIEELRRTGKPKTLDATAVKSRIHDVMKMVTDFVSDFRAVEEDFRRQREFIQSLYLGQEHSRGDIVEHSLNATEELKGTDTGRSFFDFLRLLRSAQSTEQLRARVEHVTALAHRYQIDAGALNGLLFKLHREVERVQTTYGRITRQLKSVVEESFRRDRRLALDAIAQIKRCSHQMRDNPPAHATMMVPMGIKVMPLMGVRFYERPRKTTFNLNLTADENGTSLSDFFSQIGPSLRLKKIKELIEEELGQTTQISLSEMLAKYPLKHGVVDLLCYLFVAGGASRHETLEQEIEVPITGGEGPRVARLPELIFRRKETWQKSA
ncbi:MAG TPA: DUF3375 family protein, partial [Opitutaceae bacterium]